jgi:hypothetical protein
VFCHISEEVLNKHYRYERVNIVNIDYIVNIVNIDYIVNIVNTIMLSPVTRFSFYQTRLE